MLQLLSYTAALEKVGTFCIMITAKVICFLQHIIKFQHKIDVINILSA